MRTTVRVLFDTIKVCLLFIICTVGFYFGLRWLDQNYESYHKYDEPTGRAVKVYGDTEEQQDSVLNFRLIEFFRNGE